MITVAILINGNLLMARSAVNQAKQNDKGETMYVTDSSEIVWHKREDGALKLAHKLLDTIRENGLQSSPNYKPETQESGT